MLRIRKIIPILALLLMTACIKQYNPAIEAGASNKIVVSGRISNLEGWQQIDLSRSSSLETADYIPLPGCTVNVYDNQGNTFSFPENEPGTYRAWMAQEFLVPGTSYKITIDTPEGERIESSYDTLMPGPVLDSVYYIIEDHPTSDPDVNIRGLQFYVDLNATNSDSKNYKWEITETWEYHAAHPKEYYYDRKFHQLIPPDYTHFICWITKHVRNVYDLSTKTLSQNVYHQFPLQFVDGHSSSRLGIQYSILVTQLAISESAYYYWDQMRINSSGAGGLYEKQPFAIKGNLQNLTNPGKEVLGYFYTVTESSRRYFYKDTGIPLEFSNFCIEDRLPLTGWAGFRQVDFPVWYYYNDSGELRILSKECIDCRRLGGTITKPDFWPEQ